MQTGRNRASALTAVGFATVETWLNPGLQIRGVVHRHPGENALIRVCRRRRERFRDTRSHEQGGIPLAQTYQLRDERPALGRRDHLGALFAYLRGVQTQPDPRDLRLRRPERQVFVQIPRPLELGPRDHPADVHPPAGDVLQDALVGGGCPALVVIGLQAVDGDSNADVAERVPLRWYRNDPARDHQRLDAHAAQFRQDPTELPVANERLSADDGEVNRPMQTHKLENAVDQRVATEVPELP